MNNCYQMFLLAVEEMNFTKAAERAFVTQQCLSNNIKRLEEKYGVLFFERIPRLALTPAGEIMYETIQQMKIVEDNMFKRINEIINGTVGEIKFGINVSRARILLPKMLEEYAHKFPQVRISVILDDTKNLIEKLLHNELDLFLGINCISNENLNVIPVNHDSVYLIATESFLNKWYAGNTHLQFKNGDTLDLHQFPGMPFAGNLSISTTNQLIEYYLNSQNIYPNQRFLISDYETQISLCGENLVAAFCPQLILGHIIDYNRLHIDKEPIKIFKLHGMNENIRIEIIHLSQVYLPYYMECFIKMIRQHIISYSNKTESYFSLN